jgi:inosine-uridine nucleoside N-ribohydrolase
LPVWVDCDIALGASKGDVDDGYALFACAAAPGARLLGVSTVFGNTGAATAAGCARRLLDVAGSRAPVLRGADGPAAVVPAVVDALVALPRGAQLLCLGPLSNVAAALRADPALGRRVTLWLVGGDLTTWGRFPPYWPFEFNLALDPGAARAVLAADAERRLFPLPVCRRLRVGPRRLRQLARTSPEARYLVRHSLRWLAYTPLRYQALSFPLWDLVPALCALGELPVRFSARRLALHGRGGLRPQEDAPPTLCADGFDPAAAYEALLRLCAAPRQERGPGGGPG